MSLGGIDVMGAPIGVGNLRKERMRAKRYKTIPLASLSPMSRRQLTSHGKGHSTNAGKPHQGNKEAARRLRRLEREG